MVESTWRELCKKIMDEKDPRRLMTLVEALNKELDQREQELRSRRQHPLRNRECDVERLDDVGHAIRDIVAQDLKRM